MSHTASFTSIEDAPGPLRTVEVGTVQAAAPAEGLGLAAAIAVTMSLGLGCGAAAFYLSWAGALPFGINSWSAFLNLSALSVLSLIFASVTVGLAGAGKRLVRDLTRSSIVPALRLRVATGFAVTVGRLALVAMITAILGLAVVELWHVATMGSACIPACHGGWNEFGWQGQYVFGPAQMSFLPEVFAPRMAVL